MGKVDYKAKYQRAMKVIRIQRKVIANAKEAMIEDEIPYEVCERGKIRREACMNCARIDLEADNEDGVPSVLIDAYPSERIVDANNAFLERFGYSLIEVIGQRYTRFIHAGELDENAIVSFFNKPGIQEHILMDIIGRNGLVAMEASKIPYTYLPRERGKKVHVVTRGRLVIPGMREAMGHLRRDPETLQKILEQKERKKIQRAVERSH